MSKVAVAGIEADRRDPQRHVFSVAVYSGVDREVAMKNLAKLLDERNQDSMRRGMRPDMAVISE